MKHLYNSYTTHLQNTIGLCIMMLMALPTFLSAQNWSKVHTHQSWSEAPKQFTVDDGLPTLDLYHIIQDQKGYLWIATDVGVAIFDGYDFDVLTMRDGLSNNNVIRIREDQQERIWLSSIGPLCLLEDRKPQILDIPALRRPKDGYDLLESAEGGFWLNRGSEYAYLDTNLELRALPPRITFPSVLSKRSIAQGPRDTILLYTNDQFYFTHNDQILDSISLPDVRMEANFAYAYTSGGIYFTSREGLQYWSFQDNSVTRLDTEVQRADELAVEGRQLFVLHGDYGLKIYDIIKGGKLALCERLRPSAYCNSYLLDFEKNLWITTKGEGLFFYPRRKITTAMIEVPGPKERVHKLEMYDEQLLLGSYHGGIYTYQKGDREANLWIRPNSWEGGHNDRIRDMAFLPNDQVIIGKDSGLYEVADDTLRLLSGITVKALHFDPENGLTINTKNSCHFLNIEQLIALQGSPQKESAWVLNDSTAITTERGYSSYIAKDGTIWVDNTKKGLTSIQDGVATSWKKRSNIFGIHINDMLELPDSTMVFATHGEGIILLKNGDFWVIDEVEQLPSNIVNALHLADGTLWVGTNRGVARLEDLDLRRRHFRINVYNRNDGLPTEDIADLLVWENQVLLATRIGVILIPLDQKPDQEVYPRMVLKQAEANGFELDLSSASTLGHDQNNINFQFLGISFRSKGKIRYRYRLKGYDQDWASTTNREITYNNLSPGLYTFEVHAVDYKGLVSLQPATVSFSITPHFTQRVIFWILVAVAAIALLIGGIHSYLSIRERNVLSLLVAEKTATLDRQVEELARSNEELEQFAHAASHDLRSPLRNVANFVQLLERRAKDRLKVEEQEYINLAIRGVEGMEQTINDLLKVARIDQYDEIKEQLNFANIVEEVKEANLTLIEEQNASIVMETSFPDLSFSKVNALQLLQNLIINGITYRSEDPPIIRLSCRDNGPEWLFSIADNGIGIAPEFQQKIFGLFHRLHHQKDIPGTGIGLAICKKIVERNGGKMGVHSEAGKGATFFFSIPKQ